MREWLSRFRTLTTQFFSVDEQHESELDALRGAIDALDRAAAIAAFRQPVSLELARSALERELQVPGRGFLSGGVTFCAMVPMRSLPFDVVCLIGMGDDAFPRQQRPYGFDLMVGDPRRGDPSRRDDDRYLFLESLLYAKRCLYLSYCGQDQRDNSGRPPSVLVTELMDYIERGYRTQDGGNAVAQILLRHPLQPFSSMLPIRYQRCSVIG
jgi:exodeoxyribonuclease V gamma subunit